MALSQASLIYSPLEQTSKYNTHRNVNGENAHAQADTCILFLISLQCTSWSSAFLQEKGMEAD